MIKKPILLVLLLSTVFCGMSQEKFSKFYYQRATLLEQLPTDSVDIVFLGNSITNAGEWRELFGNIHVKNRGISGDICEGVLARLSGITSGKPNKIFLMIGVNDLGRGASIDSIATATRKIIEKIQTETPQTQIYLQSVLPVNDAFGMFRNHTARWMDIKPLNQKLRILAENAKIAYIDLYSSFIAPETEKLNPEYTNDGLHLLGNGYLKWVEIIRANVNDK